MKIITIDESNIDKEHICCAITEKKGEDRVGCKKRWLKERFKDGLVFKKLDARGKVFIEYIPAEKSFAPIIAPNYMYINCFWVSGKYKGQGYSNELLNECIEDAKAKSKSGLVILGSKKKMHFISDPKYMKYKGFEICDHAKPQFELLYLPFDSNAKKPKFKDCVKSGSINYEGLAIYYSDGCPHSEQYTKLAEDVLVREGIDYKINKITTTEQAQNAPLPCTNYGVFINGQFITSEVLTEKKLLKMIEIYNLK